jgi:hypothetical protein
MFYVFTSFVKRDKLILYLKLIGYSWWAVRVLARTGNSSCRTALTLIQTCIQLAHGEELILT